MSFTAIDTERAFNNLEIAECNLRKAKEKLDATPGRWHYKQANSKQADKLKRAWDNYYSAEEEYKDARIKMTKRSTPSTPSILTIDADVVFEAFENKLSALSPEEIENLKQNLKDTGVVVTPEMIREFRIVLKAMQSVARRGTPKEETPEDETVSEPVGA